MIATTITASSDGLRERRKRLGLTQIELAIQAEISTTTLAQFEAGLLPKRSRALHRVLDALQVAEKTDAAHVDGTKKPDGDNTRVADYIS